jgi:hypothetical protein
MRKSSFWIFVQLILIESIFSQSLTPAVLKEIQQNYLNTKPNQAIINALYENELNKIAKNQKNRIKELLKNWA